MQQRGGRVGSRLPGGSQVVRVGLGGVRVCGGPGDGRGGLRVQVGLVGVREGGGGRVAGGVESPVAAGLRGRVGREASTAARWASFISADVAGRRNNTCHDQQQAVPSPFQRCSAYSIDLS